MELFELFISPFAAARWTWSIQNPKMWIGYFTVSEKDYKVEINGVSYGASKDRFRKPSPEVFSKIFENTEDDTIYNVTFGIITKTDKAEWMSTSPILSSTTSDNVIVLTTVIHMVNEFAHHINPKAIGVWPSHWKLKNVYKGMFSRVFKGWKQIPATHDFSDGFLVVPNY